MCTCIIYIHPLYICIPLQQIRHCTLQTCIAYFGTSSRPRFRSWYPAITLLMFFSSRHSGDIEIFNAKSLANTSKRQDFDFHVYEMRRRLTVIEHNANVHRIVRFRADGTPYYTRKYSKVTRNWVPSFYRVSSLSRACVMLRSCTFPVFCRKSWTSPTLVTFWRPCCTNVLSATSITQAALFVIRRITPRSFNRQ